MPGAINHWLRPVGSELRVLLEARYTFAATLVGGQVLDWSCGYGLGTSILAAAPAVVAVQGMDVDGDAVHYAQGALRHRAVRFDICDIEQAPMPCVDWLVCCETLEHLVAPAAFMHRAQQRVRQGIVLSVPIWPTVGRGNHTHRHDFTAEHITRLFEAPLAAGRWELIEARTLQEHRRDKVVMEYLLAGWRHCTRGGAWAPDAPPGS